MKKIRKKFLTTAERYDKLIKSLKNSGGKSLNIENQIINERTQNPKKQIEIFAL